MELLNGKTKILIFIRENLKNCIEISDSSAHFVENEITIPIPENGIVNIGSLNVWNVLKIDSIYEDTFLSFGDNIGYAHVMFINPEPSIFCIDDELELDICEDIEKLKSLAKGCSEISCIFEDYELKAIDISCIFKYESDDELNQTIVSISNGENSKLFKEITKNEKRVGQ